MVNWLLGNTWFTLTLTNSFGSVCFGQTKCVALKGTFVIGHCHGDAKLFYTTLHSTMQWKCAHARQQKVEFQVDLKPYFRIFWVPILDLIWVGGGYKTICAISFWRLEGLKRMVFCWNAASTILWRWAGCLVMVISTDWPITPGELHTFYNLCQTSDIFTHM